MDPANQLPLRQRPPTEPTLRPPTNDDHPDPNGLNKGHRRLFVLTNHRQDTTSYATRHASGPATTSILPSKQLDKGNDNEPPPWRAMRPQRNQQPDNHSTTLTTGYSKHPQLPDIKRRDTTQTINSPTKAHRVPTKERTARGPAFLRALLGWETENDRLHPLPVRVGARYRPIQTGGGLQCLGRHNPDHRSQPRLRHLRHVLVVELVRPYYRPDAPDRRCTLLDDFQHSARMGRTRKGHCPFPEDQLTRTRLAVSKHLLEHGFPHVLDITPRQPFFLDLLAATASACQDTEHKLPRQIRKDGGVPLGVHERLEEIPDHYPNDKPEGDPDLDPPMDPDIDNYESSRVHLTELQTNYSKDKDNGLVEGPFHSKQEVKHYLLGQDPVLLPLGAKAEKDKTRSIQDGSAPGTNARIQRNCITRIQLPGIQDARAISAIAHKRKIRLGLLQIDFSQAHRRVPILPKDHRYLVVQILHVYWVNLVGTYGVASAQFYWGRMAGLLIRLAYHIVEHSLNPADFFWAFIYVDDALFYFDLQYVWQQAGLQLLFLCTLGAPLAWKKLRLGVETVFLGFNVELREHTYALTQEKKDELTRLGHTIDNDNYVALKNIRTYTHKAAWAVQVTEPLRPFLQPLFSFIHATKDEPKHYRVTPPLMVRYVNRYLLTHWATKAPATGEFRRPLRQHSATDAGASLGSKSIAGWTGVPGANRWDCEWFAVDLLTVTGEERPDWLDDFLKQLYPGSQPSAASGALELLADLALLQHLKPRLQRAAFMSTAPASTDNLGNTYVLTKHYTNRWPGAALLMELSSILLETESHMTIRHEPRERNTWADDLANMHTAGFDPAKRWDVLAELRDTNVLADLLRYGRQLGLHLPKKEREQKRPTNLVPAGLARPAPGRPEPTGAKRQRQ